MALYMLSRAATSTAFAAAKCTVSLRAHGQSKLCQQLYGSPRAPMSSLFFSSSTSSTSRSKKKPCVPCQENNNSSSDSDEDKTSSWETTDSDEDNSSSWDATDSESDNASVKGDSPTDVENHVGAPKSNQVPDPDPTNAILDYIGYKLQQNTTTSTPAERLRGLPFSLEYLETSPTSLTLKRKYGNEEINVKVCKYALDAGKDLVPLSICVSKEGDLSLHLGVNAFPGKLEITHFLTSSTDARGLRLYEEPPFSEISGNSNLSMSFIEYLNIRGITPSTINCLRVEKEQEKGSFEWMKSLKKFMEM